MHTPLPSPPIVYDWRPALHRFPREQPDTSESESEDGIEEDEADDEDMSESDDLERPPRPASSKPKRASSGGRRTRRNILPRIMRGERCGNCHTCINPQVFSSGLCPCMQIQLSVEAQRSALKACATWAFCI